MYYSDIQRDYLCLQCGATVVADRISVQEAATRLGISRAALRARLHAEHCLVYPDGVNLADVARLAQPTLPRKAVRPRGPKVAKAEPVPKLKLGWEQASNGEWRRALVSEATPPKKETP